jgi:predicted dehydrogenase
MLLAGSEYGTGGARPLRAAVVGAGRISAEHLRFLAASPLVELTAVCDLSPSLASYAAARFPNEGGRLATVFTDSGRMLDELQPDVVHILTPAHTHVGLATDALQAGAHVIVEKPVAPTNSQFQQLWKVAENKGLRVVEDHNYRFNEETLRIERLLRRGELGEVREVEVRMALNMRHSGARYMDENLPHPSHNLPAGAIHEFITHLSYLALRFLPRAVDLSRLAAAWTKHGGGNLLRHDDLDALLITGPAHARVRFTSHIWPDCFTLTVRGTRGWAETDLFQPHLRVVIPRIGGERLTPTLNHLVNGTSMVGAGVLGLKDKVLQKSPYHGIQTFLRHTYAALATDREPPVTYRDMDQASRLVDALLDETNRL